MRAIPFLLIYARLFIGIIIPIFVAIPINNVEKVIVILMIIGLLTDVFDGIIARKLKVSSEKLRIWDSSVDQFFWLSIIGSVFYLRISIVLEIITPILLLIVLEVISYLISYVKFRKPVATHSILAKFWTLSMLAFLIEFTLYSSAQSFWICFVLGVVSRVEIMAILLLLKQWATDVPSIFAVGKMNRGEKVKKWKIFN